MKSTTALPAKGVAHVCELCGLKSWAPIVIAWGKLDGQKRAGIGCANLAACRKRRSVTARRRAEQSTEGRT